MIPPHVNNLLPPEGGTFSDGVIVLEGSLLGLLFDEDPPEVTEVQTGRTVPVTWTEEVISEWSSPPPAIGGDRQTRVEIRLESFTKGFNYRLKYPSSLRSVSEAILTAE